MGHQGGDKDFSENDPNFLNYVQYFQLCPAYFPGGEKFSKGGSTALRPLFTGLCYIGFFLSQHWMLNAFREGFLTFLNH